MRVVIVKKLILNATVALACVGLSFGALAATKSIEVTSEVDNTIDMVSGDGSPLPSNLVMGYTPGVGLQPVILPVKFITNDLAKSVQISLVGPAKLTNIANSAKVAPLRVKYDERVIGTTAITLNATELFPAGQTLATGSIVQNLEIAQATPQPLDSGSYQGIVSILISQP